jgi:hypothetical protein
MLNKRIVVMVALALSASLFTRGYGQGGGIGGVPNAVTCNVLISKTCANFSLPSMQWPAGPTESNVDCLNTPPFAAGRPCVSNFDCPNSPSATHNVNRTEWDRIRSVSGIPPGPPPFYQGFGYGWWGIYAKTSTAFVCQWKTSCTSCAFNQGALSGKCSTLTEPIRMMGQVEDAGIGPCFVFADF